MHAQTRHDGRFSVGHSFISEDLRDGREYALWILVLGASREIISIREKAHFNAVIELHYGDVSTISKGKPDIDLACNLAAELLWEFHKSLGMHFSVGSGPAYQSSVSKVQDNGFLFSNNFTLGLRFSLFDKRVVLNPQVRFRHMSNARLKSPNAGIDNFLLLLGVAVPLGEI
jgi:hypothetical protein